MQRWPKPILAFGLSIEIFPNIVAFFMIRIILKLAQVLFILYLIFFDYNCINFYSRYIGWLTLLVTIHIFFPKLNRDLVWLTKLVWLAITTITITIISNRDIGSLFNFGVFFAFKITFYELITIRTTGITLLY